MARKQSIPARFAPRLLPIAIVAMLALAGVKAVGLVRQAIAAGAGPSAGATPAPTPSGDSRAPPATSRQSTNPVPPARQPEVILAAPAPSAEPGVSAAEKEVLLDLRRRRIDLDGREAALAARENVLAAAEKRLAGRIEELVSLQSRLEGLEKSRQDREEENWRGLVKLYETMKPRDAAAIFNDLDKPVLIALLDRMKESKAAPILSAMQPERARQVTADLAQGRLAGNRPDSTTGTSQIPRK